jgi:S1-C subfamily serine protease
VNKASTVAVTLTDGTEFTGEVLGQDDYMDLAVVRIDPDGRKLKAARVSSSNDVQVGDYAIAVGNPFKLSNSVTLGIVSGIGRPPDEAGLPNEKVNFLQTDAVLNPGNSGGPLVNEFGEVIGINSAIIKGANGIGFSIPIDEAIPAIEALAQGQKLPHAYIGVGCVTVTPEKASKNNVDPNRDYIVPEVEGAFIARVQPNGPAINGGLRKLDVVVEANGIPVKRDKDLTAIVDSSKVGQPLEFKVMRGDEIIPLTVYPADLSQRA